MSVSPRYRVERKGLFSWVSYVNIYDILSGNIHFPIWFYVGMYRSRRNAQVSALNELQQNWER
jgi:hypothetical protein